VAEEAKRRFMVKVEEGPAHGGLYELEQTTFYRLVDTRSNEVVMTFEGEMSARLDGGVWSDHQYSGVCEVTVAPDERSVRVKYHGGHEETVPLPTKSQ
jgi:hypothetical protein